MGGGLEGIMDECGLCELSVLCSMTVVDAKCLGVRVCVPV